MNFKSLVMPMLLVCLTPLVTLAQEPTKFGKISKADLSMTSYQSDTSAVAVILLDKGDLDFNFSEGSEGYLLDRHRRIKILKRPGFDYGDISIPYYTGGEGEKIKGLKALVHSPDGSVTKLSKSDFFKEEVNENWTLMKFSFPDIQEGSILEYQYTLNSPYLSSLPEWFFQDEIPTRWSEYNLAIPEWYKYVAISQGRQLDVSENEVKGRSFRVSIPGRARASQQGTVNLEVLYYHLIMKDVPALKEESYITNMDDYRSRVRFQLKATAYDRIYKPYMSTWPQITEELMEAENFGMQLSKKKNFKAIGAALANALDKASTEGEKAQIIYNHINQQIEWNGDYRTRLDGDLAEVYEKKLGTSAEINLLLLGMLREQGIKAMPMLVSTRSHGKMIELYPILSQFNHVMLVADLDGKEFILDAGDRSRPIGTPRVAVLNGYRAALLDPANAAWISLPVQSSKSVQMATVTMDEDGMIKGDMAEMKKGYYAVYFRDALSESDSKDFFEERYMASIPEIEIGKIDIEGKDDLSKTFKSHVNFTIPNQAMVNGDYIYFTPILNKWYDENPFKLEERSYPVDFAFPTDQRYILSMEIPEGYTIEELPENVNLTLPNQSAMFTYSVKQLGSKIALNCSLKINQVVFKPEEYQALKKFFDLVVEKQNEQLVLKYSDN